MISPIIRVTTMTLYAESGDPSRKYSVSVAKSSIRKDDFILTQRYSK